MSFRIRNKGGSPLGLPFPLGGILGPGDAAVVDLTEDEIRALIGDKADGYIEVFDVGSQPSDTLFEGSSKGAAITTPLRVTGDIDSDAQVIGATGVVATAGGVTATAGDIVATAGDVVVTAGDLDVTVGDVDVAAGGVNVPAGDLTALGGFRMLAGPFVAPGAVGVTAADQTDLDCEYAPIAAAVIDFVATRAGSVMGISAAIDTAITGSGTQITAEITINGTEVVGGPVATLTEAGAEVAASAVIAKDVAGAVFAAGDTIGVSYSSTTITNTPKLVVTVELEQ